MRCRSNGNNYLRTPGTGKTTRLIEIVQQNWMKTDQSLKIVSFSRKAAEEARERAASKLNMDVNQMIWFRHT